DSRAHDGHGDPARVQRASVRGGVDAQGQAADDDHPSPSELEAELLRDGLTVRRRSPRADDRHARSVGRWPPASGAKLSLHPPIPAGVFATGAAHPCVAACAPVLAHPRVRSGPVLAAPSAELAPARIHSAWPAGTGSGSDILEPEAERLQDVVFFDLLRAIEVGRGAGHPPRTMKAARGHAALRGPALERAARWRREAGQLAETGGLELRVEHPLPFDL